ncbi:signal peptidase I [Paenibacillus sp. NPDC058071]|uniref:signal peptidase I n=1 Tax=Paenibacillus sp. NPDC058071 TaxID=3346326 RepID=UPI0036D96B97
MPDNGSQPKKRSWNWKKELREWTVALGAAILISFLFQNYMYAQSQVHNISMQNTLVAGQRLIEDKWSYRFNAPLHRDIVIIKGPESPKRLVKRVVGVAGDIIDIRDGKLILNGLPVEEPYTKGMTNPGSFRLPYTVEEGSVFVMGDNREQSEDSRDLGPIALSSIEGKAVYRIWPIAKFGDIN